MGTENRLGRNVSRKAVILLLVTGLGVYCASVVWPFVVSKSTWKRNRAMTAGENERSAVNCKALIDGDKKQLDEVMDLMKTERVVAMSGYSFQGLVRDCDTFKKIRGYVTTSLTPEEEDFPIAFSILMYKDVEQAERLLRAIYRPQNYYCVHVDIKAKHSVKVGMDAIVGCFDNVFLAPRMINVTWGQFSVLEADLVCMQALWEYRKWKYFINLTGQEFPLKTNRELVKILTAYDGANDMEGTVKRADPLRWRNRKTGKPSPHGIRLVKGSVKIAASRAYVDYVLHNKTSRALLEWVNNTIIPDETFFATLNHNPQLGVPGSYNGEPETDSVEKPFLARFVNWWDRWTCHGIHTRGICIFGVGDLPLLTSRPELFANKFYWDFQHYTLNCLEEWHYNKTRDGYMSASFNSTYYHELGFVKNKI